MRHMHFSGKRKEKRAENSRARAARTAYFIWKWFFVNIIISAIFYFIVKVYCNIVSSAQEAEEMKNIIRNRHSIGGGNSRQAKVDRVERLLKTMETAPMVAIDTSFNEMMEDKVFIFRVHVY